VNFQGERQVATQLQSDSRFKENSYYGHTWVLKANGDTRVFTLGEGLFSRSNVENRVSYLDISQPGMSTTQPTTRPSYTTQPNYYITTPKPAYWNNFIESSSVPNYNSYTSNTGFQMTNPKSFPEKSNLFGSNNRYVTY